MFEHILMVCNEQAMKIDYLMTFIFFNTFSATFRKVLVVSRIKGIVFKLE